MLSFSVFRILDLDLDQDVYWRRSAFVDGNDHFHFSCFINKNSMFGNKHVVQVIFQNDEQLK